MATLIPGARFVPLEGHSHVLFSSDPTWKIFADKVVSFPRDRKGKDQQAFSPHLPALTAREQVVLELVAQGKDNGEIAHATSLSEKTVRNFVSTIIGKFQAAGRAQAILSAREAGYGFGAARPAR